MGFFDSIETFLTVLRGKKNEKFVTDKKVASSSGEKNNKIARCAECRRTILNGAARRKPPFEAAMVRGALKTEACV